jgi:DHA1 family bicyclomycin/chloramphenicol resistance-like MFS transporter
MFRVGSMALLVFIGGLVSMGAFSTDMFIPAMPAIRADFAAGVGVAQLTFGAFWYAFAVGQFLVGPLADRFGRRPLLIGGMALLCLASLACALAPSIETLILARVVQAIGVSAAWVLSRAIIRDLHGPEGTTRMMGYAFAIMSFLSATLPVSGGYLTETFGWRVVFLLPAVLGALYVAAVWCWFPESAPARRMPVRLAAVAANMAFLLRNRLFAGYLLCQCLTLATVFVCLANGPFVFVEVFAISPTVFGLAFIAMEGALMAAALLTAPLIGRWGRRRLLALGTTLPLLGSLFLLALASSGTSSLWPYLGPLAAISFGVGFVMPVAQSGGLEPHPELAGTASSLLGVGQSLSAATFGTIAAGLFDGSALPMIAAMIVAATGGVLVYAVRLSPLLPRQA